MHNSHLEGGGGGTVQRQQRSVPPPLFAAALAQPCVPYPPSPNLICILVGHAKFNPPGSITVHFPPSLSSVPPFVVLPRFISFVIAPIPRVHNAAAEP